MDLRRLRQIQSLRGENPARVPRWRRVRAVPRNAGDETAQVSALLMQLANDQRHLHPLKSLTHLMAAAVGLYIASLLITTGTAFWNILLVISASLLALNTFVVVGRARSRFRARQSVLRQLTGYDDTRAIGPLIQALYRPDRRLRYAARIALARLLPLLQAGDTEMNTFGQYGRLYRQLTAREAARSPDFVCAILNASIQFGDARALPGVQHLAALQARTAMHKRLRQAARDCLPLLSARIDQTQTRQAEQLRIQQQTNPSDTKAITKVMDFLKEEEEKEAAPLTGAVWQKDGETLDVLSRRFQQVSRLHRLRVRRAIWLGAVSGLALMLINVVALIILLQTERYPFAAMWWIWIVNAFVFGACVVYPLRSAAERRTAASELASYEDVRVVGPLTELLSSSDMAVRKSARIALISLLPRLTPSDAHWLNDEQRDTLCRVLEDAQGQPELAEAILLAFEQVGDSSALAVVQRIAEMPARDARHKRLQAVARQCLPHLRSRIQYEGARQTLLRAHNANSTDSAILLRVPAAVPDQPSQELLRPTQHT